MRPPLDLTIPATSVEYVEVTIFAKSDPTSNTVTAALKDDALGDPSGADFKAAEWDTSQTNAAAKTYVARFLFGGVNFPVVADRHYNVYIRIDAATEDPVLFVGQVHTI